MYIYYEEVTKGMRDFEQFPHHLPMNIEAPASTSEPQEFIWRLPLNKREGEHTSYIKNFESSASDLQTVPQTNTATVEYRFHYRYQPVQTGRSMVPIPFPDPEVFIDCMSTDLRLFAWKYEAPVINQLTEENGPTNRDGLTQLIPAGRVEHRMEVTVLTLSLTLIGMVLTIQQVWEKAQTSKIRVPK